MKLLTTTIIFILLLSQNHLSQTNCSGEEILKEKNCLGDDFSSQEKELFNLVNEYRRQNNLAEVPVSKQLCVVANRHALDLQRNIKKLTHSWSDCEYNATDLNTYNCIYKAPKRFDPSFTGSAYENAFLTSGKTISNPFVLKLWQKSPLHNSLMLNLSSFTKAKFNGGCTAIAGSFAVLWFSSDLENVPPNIRKKSKGLGVTFDEAIKGINKIVPINQDSFIIERTKWVGANRDKSVVIEMYGTAEDIDESNISLRIKLEKNKVLSVISKHLLQTFLKNMAPNWKQRDQWLERSLLKIKSKPNDLQKIDVKNISIELSLTPDKYIFLIIKPNNKPVPIEF